MAKKNIPVPSKEEIIFELADNLLCLFAISYKQGYTFNELVLATRHKMQINNQRNWQKLPDGIYKHIK
jgi:hypothetical protein